MAKVAETDTRARVNVLVTSLQAISDPKMGNVCESIKGRLLNENAYKTHVRRKMTSSNKIAISDFLYFVILITKIP